MTVDDAGKRRNEELNILLVIVGLLAATITSFVIYIQPQLQESSADDATALLRVLVYTATNGSLPGSGPHPTLPTWSGAPATLVFAQFTLYACLAATLLCGLYAMLIKFLTDSNALNWKNKVVDWFTRWVFFVIYLLLSGVFFWLFVALILQIPLLPSVTTLRIVKKLGGKA
ncbi:hypothetical protein BJ322DRAFT_1018231 [Thelephora terrestris]|uniref:DUF6535 domain-containing protein n=1 Tax=Thelephora terrestris TaxID=56493 RepID=A0A9P6HMP4_9AGAM|nr:hypothetical protein BJ322DRAFT_1018231 [Thelephora terrestris]